MSENEWKWTSVSEWIERIERNEWVLRNEWTRGATLWDDVENKSEVEKVREMAAFTNYSCSLRFSALKSKIPKNYKQKQ